MLRMAPDYVAELSPGQKLRILLPNQKLRSLIIFREGHFKIWKFLETLDSLGGIEHDASWNWIKNRVLHQNVNSSLNEILLRWYNSLIPMFALTQLKQGNFFCLFVFATICHSKEKAPQHPSCIQLNTMALLPTEPQRSQKSGSSQTPQPCLSWTHIPELCFLPSKLHITQPVFPSFSNISSVNLDRLLPYAKD